MYRVSRKLFKILTARQRKMAGLLLLLMLIGAVMESLSVSLVLPLVTAVMDPQGWDAAWYSRLICGVFGIRSQRTYVQTLLLLLIVVFVAKDIYIVCEYYIQYSFIAKGRLQLQRKLMESYMKKPYSFYLNASSGEVIRIITGDTGQAYQVLATVLSFLTEVIISGALGITILVMSPALALSLLAVLLLEISVIAKVVKPVMERLGVRSRAAGAATNKWILQAFNGIKSIKVSRTEDFFNRMYSQNAEKIVDVDRKQQTLNNVPRLLIESISVTAVLGIVFVQVAVGRELVDIMPQLSAFVVAAMRLLPSMNRISTSINYIPFYEGGLDNVIRVIEEDRSLRMDTRESEKAMAGNKGISGEQSTKADSVPKATAQAVSAGITFENSLVLNDISFAYPGTDKLILDHVSLSISPGQSVGIVGSSGAGKTTTVDIMLGLLKAQKGKVIVDGADIEEDMAGWLRKVAYIPQKIFLLDSTIRDNVAFGKEYKEIDEEKVWEALREAQMEEFVLSLPEGIDTMVGEQGIRLSGGQCQRIGIARALYCDPDILFFDEATSSLDNETEAAIMEAIDNLKGSRTLIIIAHRLTTIENCDIVYRVENGRILRER